MFQQSTYSQAGSVMLGHLMSPIICMGTYVVGKVARKQDEKIRRERESEREREPNHPEPYGYEEKVSNQPHMAPHATHSEIDHSPAILMIIGWSKMGSGQFQCSTVPSKYLSSASISFRLLNGLARWCCAGQRVSRLSRHTRVRCSAPGALQ